MLAGRRILLAVTGGVAAYKSAYLARRLIEQGAEVRALMTTSAQKFLGAQTLEAITGSPVGTQLFGGVSASPHTDLARWADLMVIAPLTASSMARLVHGQSSDILSATYLAAERPVFAAPAMHTEMWMHPATQRNQAALAADGVVMIGPVDGPLAGGDVGPGRMAEPDDIVAAIEAHHAGTQPRLLDGWRVVVSAGGTREAIDPVRYIGNRSSGKMGNALAVAAAAMGADVTLVTTAAAPAAAGITVIDVESAQDMAEAVWAAAAGADVAVLAAAVADFRPKDPTGHKLRRADGLAAVELEATPDILAGVAAMEPRPFLVGFAAEVGSIDGAVTKAKTKGVDLLVGNDVGSRGSGFGTDTNQVTIIWPDGTSHPWPLLSKTEVATRLWETIAKHRSGSDH